MTNPTPPDATDQPARDPTEAAPAATRARLDADGRERPAFVLNFPHDPELDALVAAYERGNFALVRKAAPLLAASTSNEAVKSAALELRRRIDPDTTVVLLLGLAVLLFGFLAVWAYW